MFHPSSRACKVIRSKDMTSTYGSLDTSYGSVAVASSSTASSAGGGVALNTNLR
jgi:hypothetical protein